MKFDFVIGNPPYQENDGGGTGDSAKPVYQLFIIEAKKITNYSFSFIVPSRWMKGGKGLNDFRSILFIFEIFMESVKIYLLLFAF